MRVFLDATAVTRQASGARERLLALYTLVARRKEVELTAAVRADAGLDEPFKIAGARVKVDAHPPPAWARGVKALNGPAREADLGGHFDLFDVQTLPFPRTRNAPPVVTLHDLRFLRKGLAPWHRRKFARIFLARMLSGARGIVTVSPTVREEMMAAFPCLDPGRIRVVPNAAPPGTALDERRRKELLRNLDAPLEYLLCLGHLEPRKNTGLLLEAFSLMDKRDVGLVLAGAAKPGYRASVLERCEAVNRAQGKRAALWLGPVSKEEKAALLQSARAAVQPSLYEGFGLGILEALKENIPLACSRIPAHGEVAGEGAVYFDPSSAEDAARAMEKIAFDEEVRERLKAKGGQRAGRYSWQRSAEKLVESWSDFLS